MLLIYQYQFGSTSQHQNQSIDVHEYNGGTIISDGSVNIEANDATKSGVNLVGSRLFSKRSKHKFC